MLPLVRHFQSNAAHHVESLLSQNPVRVWLRERALQVLPHEWVARSWGKQFDTERELVQRIVNAGV
jgi:hypothetical protein